jgi:DNA primase
MARIPDEQLERLKAEVSVERLVGGSGIELKRSGKDWIGKCPFHEDDTASLSVTPAKNLWHCFGCGVGGGPVDWVMQKNGVSFRHAVELLREGLPSLAAEPMEGAIKRSTVRALAAPVAIEADDQALLNQTVDYYHERLLVVPEAQAYLQARGLNHPELVGHFKLGVADRTLGLRLPDKRRVAGADIRARLTRIGLYRESGHEHFNGSLIVPILDEQGDVVEVYGRKLLDNLRAGTPKHLYLPSRANSHDPCGRGVFNLVALKASKEIILCEALIDALTFWCAGYRNVTSAYGIEGLTEEHMAAFKRYGTERVLIAYDRDEAGERGAAKVAERLIAEGIECLRIQFPKGMDANEYALKVQPAAKSLGLLIRNALWLGKGDALKGDALKSKPGQAEPAAKEENHLEKTLLEKTPLPSLAAPPVVEAQSLASVALSASPIPSMVADEVPCEIKAGEQGSEITLSLGDRRYRVRGLAKNLSFELLKVNVLAARGEAFYVDTLDLYSAKQRQSYITHAALELQVREEILKTDLGRVLMRLEALQEAAVVKTLSPEPVGPKMSEAEREAALALLTSPHLIDRILADFETCGLVGESTNKIVGYLAAVSRKLDKPLGVVIQSSSAAGKTSLMDAVLAFVPPEDKVKYSAMTGQSLFYMGETNLKHKVLAIVEEEGASRASYALKLLQSEGELTMASTGKDPQSGNLITQQYRVEGPVALLLTTTARDLDEELMNRCLVLAVDEGREQTRSIHRLQRERRTLEGLLAKKEREEAIVLHQNAQRLLRPLDVLNPYAQHLSFPDQTTRLRRDHEKYLTLIDTVAFVHQHQREVKVYRRPGQGEQLIEYIEVELEDIELANRIAHEVLGRSLDELPPQTRRLLSLMDQHVATESERQGLRRGDYRFSRRVLREAIAWGDTQLRVHLERLVALEYVLSHREGPGGKYVYELVYEVKGDARAQVAGLIDVGTLAALATKENIKETMKEPAPTVAKSRGQDPQVAGQKGELAVRLRADSGAVAAKVRADELAAKTIATRVTADPLDINDEMHSCAPVLQSTSYLHGSAVAA